MTHYTTDPGARQAFITLPARPGRLPRPAPRRSPCRKPAPNPPARQQRRLTADCAQVDHFARLLGATVERRHLA